MRLNVLRILAGTVAVLSTAAQAQVTDRIFIAGMEDAAAAGGCANSGQHGYYQLSEPGTWPALFGGLAWPNPLGNFLPVTIFNRHYIALQIQLPASHAGVAGTIETAQASGMSTGPLVLSLSPCAGDFRLSELRNGQRNCVSFGTNSPVLVWVRNGAPNPSYCPMQVDTTYWLNIAYLDVPYGPPETINTCPDPLACTTLIGSRSLSQPELNEVLQSLGD